MGDPVYGQQELASGNTPYNELSFIIQRALARLNVATLVQVVDVHPGAGLLVGFVDVLPLVNQVDGSGAAVPHGTVFGVPYFRVQGGACAVICDPTPGDVGFVLFADRDISSVKVTGAQASPPSERRFDYADALYFGGWNMATPPASYVQVTPGGVTIVNPTQVQLEAGGATATLTSTGLAVSGLVTATDVATTTLPSLDAHVHGGVQTGGSTTGPAIG